MLLVWKIGANGGRLQRRSDRYLDCLVPRLTRPLTHWHCLRTERSFGDDVNRAVALVTTAESRPQPAPGTGRFADDSEGDARRC